MPNYHMSQCYIEDWGGYCNGKFIGKLRWWLARGFSWKLDEYSETEAMYWSHNNKSYVNLKSFFRRSAEIEATLKEWLYGEIPGTSITFDEWESTGIETYEVANRSTNRAP